MFAKGLYYNELCVFFSIISSNVRALVCLLSVWNEEINLSGQLKVLEASSQRSVVRDKHQIRPSESWSSTLQLGAWLNEAHSERLELSLAFNNTKEKVCKCSWLA